MTNELSYAQIEFNMVHENATDVAFKPEWKNGTGYLDGSAYAELPEIQVGGTFRFTDDFNRRAVGIKVVAGHNLVIFERYSPSDDGSTSETFVSNVTDRLKTILSWELGAVKGDDIRMVSDHGFENAYGRYKAVVS